MEINKNQGAPKISSGAMRQAAYAARMRSEGYTQRTLWLNSEEFLAVDKLLSQMRNNESIIKE